MAFLRQYDYEKALPLFFENQLGIKVERDEKYREDFWILNDGGDRVALVEAGSTIKGLSKTKVFQTYGHREENELKEDFPAILISNLHLNAGSWKDKLKSIDRRAIKAAQDNRVLILRIEDLIFYWYKINYLDGSKEEFLKTLFSESGWLEVKKKDGTIQLH